MEHNKYYAQYGKGDPIVFIHGSYASDATWKKMVEALAGDYHCITIKLPGHCGLPDPDDMAHPTIDTELNIIKQAVAAETNKPVHLVGHSYGGVVALEIALRQTLPLQSLTLFEPVAGSILHAVNDVPMWSRLQEFVQRYRQAAEEGEADVAARVIDFWGGEGAYAPIPDFIKQGMTSLVKNNLRHWDVCLADSYNLNDFKNIKIPSIVVCGSRSSDVAHAVADHLARLIPTCKKYTIDGANHFLVTTHVTECLTHLKRVVN